MPVRRGFLNACELDADRALGRWLADRRPALATILKRGTFLDRGDVDQFLNLSPPGVDELFGLLEIERLGGEEAYDQVVIDTAPTGHTLRLLATPVLFTPPGCARCRRTAARERRQIATFTSRPAWKRGGCAIILTDAITPPPRGVAALSGWEHTWRARGLRD